MLMNIYKNKKGFTIIEVVLVLAIAGLIFLMVFLALPALQRGQRDAQRKNQMSLIGAKLEQARANNKGRYISDFVSNNQFENFVSNYIKPFEDEFKDPTTGKMYEFIKCEERVHCGVRKDSTMQSKVDEVLKVGQIYYNSNAYCKDGKMVDGPGNASTFVLVTRLEGGSTYCLSNATE